MTKAEKERLSSVLRATEYLFLENLALKLVLDHRGVANWQILVDRLLDDKEILAGCAAQVYGRVPSDEEGWRRAWGD